MVYNMSRHMTHSKYYKQLKILSPEKHSSLFWFRGEKFCSMDNLISIKQNFKWSNEREGKIRIEFRQINENIKESLLQKSRNF